MAWVVGPPKMDVAGCCWPGVEGCAMSALVGVMSVEVKRSLLQELLGTQSGCWVRPAAGRFPGGR